MDCLHLNVIYDATIGLQVKSSAIRLSKTVPELNQKIAISPQIMLANTYMYINRLSKSLSFKMFGINVTFCNFRSK